MINKEEFFKILGNNNIVNKLYNELMLAIEYDITVVSEYFLTPNIWKKLPNKFDDIIISKYGYDRKKVCFHKYNDKPYFDYSVIKIEVFNKFKKYTHKDFLGSIMSLNIKRELIGDLFLQENNICYVFVSNNILDYILNNLKEVGKNNIKIEISEKRDFSYNFKDMNLIITSNRLDNLVSSITNLSRIKSSSYIENSLVLLNYEICLKKDKEFKEDDIITIKKFGKFKVFLNTGKSKKNKEKWVVKKYD